MLIAGGIGAFIYSHLTSSSSAPVINDQAVNNQAVTDSASVQPTSSVQNIPSTPVSSGLSCNKYFQDVQSVGLAHILGLSAGTTLTDVSDSSGCTVTWNDPVKYPTSMGEYNSVGTVTFSNGGGFLTAPESLFYSGYCQGEKSLGIGDRSCSGFEGLDHSVVFLKGDLFVMINPILKVGPFTTTQLISLAKAIESKL